jgi:DNA-directed RNA polymerase subunit M/transcription elongation factor TFIIS
MIDRNFGKEILSKIITSKTNVTLVERNIFKHYKEDYIDTLYQVVGLLMTYNVKDTCLLITNKKIPWKIPEFEMEIQNEKIEHDFIETPFEKTESIISCHCGSSNVMTFSKQLRSSDEGTSVIAICMSCKKRWVEGG